MSDFDLRQLIDRLDTTISRIIKGQLPWWEKVGLLVEAIVPEAEAVGEAWAGSDKKEFALHAIEEIYFRYLNSKYIPDFIERMLVRKVASVAIDNAVKLAHKKGLFTHRLPKPTA